MKQTKRGFWHGAVELILVIFVELPLYLVFEFYLGGDRPIWEDPPLVAAAWIVGFALFFYIVYRIARGQTSSFADFRHADRAARQSRVVISKKA